MTAGDVKTVLALNAGSSSLKFGLFSIDGGEPKTVISGGADAVGTDHAVFTAKDGDGHEIVSQKTDIADQAAALGKVLALLKDRELPQPDAVGHRIVHGGPDCVDHRLIDARTLAVLRQAEAFAPLHVPAALSLVERAQTQFAGKPQVACLDTAFHAGMPEIAHTLPVPHKLKAEGVRRYGFHGLSCESIVRQLGADVPDRLIVAHLGGGCSVTAIQAGKSADTSMGLTPTGGVVMSTRSGDLDPGVLLYLLRTKSMDADGLEHLLDKESGMKGVSGVSGDMRTLRQTGGDAAQLAIDLFCYSVRKQIAAMAAALGGIDLLVFTGGIGEHDAETRKAICDGLRWLKIGDIKAVLAEENIEIARHTARIAFALPRGIER